MFFVRFAQSPGSAVRLPNEQGFQGAPYRPRSAAPRGNQFHACPGWRPTSRGRTRPASDIEIIPFLSNRTRPPPALDLPGPSGRPPFSPSKDSAAKNLAEVLPTRILPFIPRAAGRREPQSVGCGRVPARRPRSCCPRQLHTSVPLTLPRERRNLAWNRGIRPEPPNGRPETLGDRRPAGTRAGKRRKPRWNPGSPRCAVPRSYPCPN